MVLPWQIDPARCESKVSVEQFLTGPDWSDKWVYEEKEDDIRALLQVRPPGISHNVLTTKTHSVNGGRLVQREDNFPHMRDYPFPEAFEDTIFDGGFYGGNFSSDVQTLIATGKANYSVWDVIRVKGVDLRQMPLSERRKVLEVLAPYFPDWMHLTKIHTDGKALLTDVLSRSREGIVIKDSTSKYGKGWIKCKRAETFDVVPMGYEESKSADYRSRGWFGSIIFGQYVDGKLKYFGKCSGMDQKTRDEISKNRDFYTGKLDGVPKVIEIKADVRFPSGMFRHPRFIRHRPDKPHTECTYRPGKEA